MAKAAIGFGSSKREGEDVEALNRLFTPEFRNRLDAVIPFGSLPTPVIHQVVQKFVMQLETQLAERNVTFDLHQDAIAWLADKGYDEKMGARPLARVIQESVKKPLADEILFGKLKKGGVVKVTVGIKADGTKGLILDSVPETARIKPKAEVVAPVRKSSKVAKPKEMETVGAEPEGGAKPKKAAKSTKTDEPASDMTTAAPRKGRTVPKVPRKK
ncbi:MAG: ATP-dependent Clp protease ATP-binding subunit ClpA, partial [Pararhizobium sp.]